jgi:acyl dehydratase
MEHDTPVWDRDFDDLIPGERFETRGRTIGESDVSSFAGLTGDHHPVHTDAAWAAHSAFGQRIAHGMLVVSYAVALLPFDPDRVAEVAVRSAVFKAPTPLGETIRVRGRISRLEEVDDERGSVRLALSVVGEDDAARARVVIEADWRRAPGHGEFAARRPAVYDDVALADWVIPI